jgi:hypothetical protein
VGNKTETRKGEDQVIHGKARLAEQGNKQEQRQRKARELKVSEDGNRCGRKSYITVHV